MAELGQNIAYGTGDPKRIAMALRDLHDYVRRLPAFELFTRSGPIVFPMSFATEISSPKVVQINVREFPETDSSVGAIGFHWRLDSARREIVITDIDGISAGTSYTVDGVVFGERS